MSPTDPAPLPRMSPPADATPADATPPKRTWRRSLLRAAAAIAIGYLVLFGVLWMLQEWMLFPGRTSQGKASALVNPVESRGETLLEFTSRRGDRIVALFCPAVERGRVLDDPRSRPVMLFFYGNGMSLADIAGFAQVFASRGMHVAAMEYPGYGMSGGTPGEAAIADAVDALLETLGERDDVNLQRLVPAGWSLGAAVAIDTAARHPTRGVVAMSPFTSVPAVAKKTFPFLPIDLLARHRFDSIAKVPSLTVPIFLSHGRRDSIVPFAMSEQLQAAAKTPVTTFWLDQADHNDFFDFGGEKLIDEVTRFVHAAAAD
jgi:pimeloyl-ACP methyl ester carboxylesterase